MTMKRILLAGGCTGLFLTLTACPPGTQSTDDSQSDFFVTSTGQGGVSGYTPQGSGWKPNTTVSIDIWNEPTGPGATNTDWKHLFDVQVDGTGMFGFNGGAKFYPVRRSICGSPENGQTVTFMAKSETGRIRMWRPGADLYFTFRPCPPG